MNDNDNVDIAMALTGGTSGTLVGYVNAMQEASLDQIPSATDYTWASNDFNAGGRGSGVEILSTDAGVSDARVLLITVTCEGSPCSYTITASTEMEHTVLQLGGTAANVRGVVFERGVREFQSRLSLQRTPRCQKYSNTNKSTRTLTIQPLEHRYILWRNIRSRTLKCIFQTRIKI